jgi:hypothetical protein
MLSTEQMGQEGRGRATRQIRLFYDHGAGLGALLAASLDVGRLPDDRGWREDEILPVLALPLRDRQEPAVRAVTGPRGRAYWVGLGRNAPVVVRAWRQFLEFSSFPQEAVCFLAVPLPSCRSWKAAERAWLFDRRVLRRTAREAIKYVQLWHQSRLSVWPE